MEKDCLTAEEVEAQSRSCVIRLRAGVSTNETSKVESRPNIFKVSVPKGGCAHQGLTSEK